MPNHITNVIEMSGSLSDLNDLINEFGTHVDAELRRTYDNQLICDNKDNGRFCWFNLETGIATDRQGMNSVGLPVGYAPEIKQSFFMFPDFRKVIPPPDDPAYDDKPDQKTAQNSPNWWHTWNVKNWGTKWGGYSYERLAINKFQFETAWSPSPIIIDTISKKYPKVEIVYSWADEDFGYNVGTQKYLNGLISEEIPDGGSNEAYELAFSVCPERREQYIISEKGSYKYKE